MLQSRTVLALVALAALAACSTNAPLATVPPETTAPPVAASTTVDDAPRATAPVAATTTVTVAPSTAPASTFPPGIELSPGGPWTRVDSAPGITTPGLFYELMPLLWVYLPTQEDIEHGILWTFTEADRDVIEAYLQAQLVYFRATTKRPIDLDDPGWSMYVDGSGMEYLEEHRAHGWYGDLDLGIVLRPQVMGDERTDTFAIVWDCLLDGGVWRQSDGAVAPGSQEGVVQSGLAQHLSASSGTWRVEKAGSQSEACL